VEPTAFRFRRLARADFPRLGDWLAQPHVARWWNHQATPAALEQDFGAAVDGLEPTEDLIALLGDEPIGLVQRARLADDPAYRAEFEAVTDVPAGAMTIDYLIGDQSRTGRGLGSAMIRAAVEDTWRRRPDTPVILTAVAETNAASWRALQRAGLDRIGTVDMQPDNPVDTTTHFVYRVHRPVSRRAP
jgi:aminoglycoside 6'-N-acetyltransferase